VGKNEGLLVVTEAFPILDFGLDLVNGIARSHFRGDDPGAQGSDKDLHVTMGTETRSRQTLSECCRRKWWVRFPVVFPSKSMPCLSRRMQSLHPIFMHGAGDLLDMCFDDNADG